MHVWYIDLSLNRRLGYVCPIVATVATQLKEGVDNKWEKSKWNPNQGNFPTLILAELAWHTVTHGGKWNVQPTLHSKWAGIWAKACEKSCLCIVSLREPPAKLMWNYGYGLVIFQASNCTIGLNLSQVWEISVAQLSPFIDFLKWCGLIFQQQLS